MTLTTRRVLVTNDDGIDAPGLRVLVPTLVAAGYTPVVVAPDRDYSGAGASILPVSNTGVDREMAEDGRATRRYDDRVLEEAPSVEAYAVHGPPALCVLLAMRGAFGDPVEGVVSGINYGLNVGPAVMHSGTVSAALTGARFGVPAIALSSEFNWEQPDEPLRYDTAAALGARLMDRIWGQAGVTLNVNVPQRSVAELSGVRLATLATATPYRSRAISTSNGEITMEYESVDEPVPAGTDLGVLKSGAAAVTPLGPVGAVPIEIPSLLDGLIEAAA